VLLALTPLVPPPSTVVCVCVYVRELVIECTYVYMCMYIHVCTYTHTYTLICVTWLIHLYDVTVCVYVCPNVSIGVYMCLYVSMYVFWYLHRNPGPCDVHSVGTHMNVSLTWMCHRFVRDEWVTHMNVSHFSWWVL